MCYYFYYLLCLCQANAHEEFCIQVGKRWISSCLSHPFPYYLSCYLDCLDKQVRFWMSELSLVPRLTDAGGARVDGWCFEGAYTIGSVRLFTLDLRQARAFHNTLARIQRVPRQGHLELRTLFNLNHLYNMLIHLQVRVDCRDECASFNFNATLKNIIHN